MLRDKKQGESEQQDHSKQIFELERHDTKQWTV